MSSFSLSVGTKTVKPSLLSHEKAVANKAISCAGHVVSPTLRVFHHKLLFSGRIFMKSGTMALYAAGILPLVIFIYRT
jgi:hypothetical protein